MIRIFTEFIRDYLNFWKLIKLEKSLNYSFFKHNKLFWKPVWPVFINKENFRTIGNLVLKYEAKQDNQQIIKELNIFS